MVKAVIGGPSNLRRVSLVGRNYDSLRSGPFGDRILMKGEIFRTIQNGPSANPAYCTVDVRSLSQDKSGPSANLASCTVGARSLSQDKSGRTVASTSIPSNTEIKERVELYLYSLPVPSWPVVQ
jgi:hypothetical protein